MKHLKPDHISALAGGLLPTAGDAGHLGACPACRRDLAELRSLIHGLEELKTPLPALRLATLQRLGLESRTRSGPRAWAWGSAMVAGLVLVWILPLVRTRIPSTITLPTLPIQTLPLVQGPSQGSTITGKRRMSLHRPARRALPASTVQPIQAALTNPETQHGVRPSGTLAESRQLPAPAASGAESVEKPLSNTAVRIVDGGDVKATPMPSSGGLKIISVRNNLLKPALGERLGFTVAVPEPEPLNVLVLDSRGRTVAVLYDAPAASGSVELSWDGGNSASGAYTVLVHAQDSFASLKVLVIR